MYRVAEGPPEPWQTGPEYQLLDNAKHHDGKNPLTSAGSAYAIYAPSKDATRPVGQWNETRLIVKGPHVEHWLNGEKVVDYELGSEDWQNGSPPASSTACRVTARSRKATSTCKTTATPSPSAASRSTS